MIAEYKPLTKFRASLTSICRAVQAGKKEVIVTFHQQPVFKVVKLKNDEIEPSIPERSFVQVVRNQSEFLDAIEQYDAVILIDKLVESIRDRMADHGIGKAVDRQINQDLAAYRMLVTEWKEWNHE